MILVRFWTVCGMLTLLLFTDSISSGLGFENGVYKSRSYDRIDEVKKQCASLISDAVYLKVRDNRFYSMIKNDLSFINGDWEQESAKAPILPFHDKLVYNSSTYAQSPLKLASFAITDVDRRRHSKRRERVVYLNGVLHMVLTKDGPFPNKYYSRGSQFVLWPGHAQLSISFQGVYTESRKTGGERVMCLLGNTMLPSRDPDSADPWPWAKGFDSSYSLPPLAQDDQILLVVRYPRTSSLRRRAIMGEMTSLNSKSNLKYFDKIHLVSQLASTYYQFGSEKILSKACDPYPYTNDIIARSVDVYKGPDFCHIFEQINHFGVSTVAPNWRCNENDTFCSRLGPFSSDKDIRATDGGFNNVVLLMQDVRCLPKNNRKSKAGSARISAVFRVVSPGESQNAARRRTGLGKKTLSVEGIWNASSGQLCMVGCLGVVDPEGVGCDSRVCLYIPVSFSIKQRSIMLGTISSIKADSPSYPPLTFEMLILGTSRWDLSVRIRPYYQYTKINNAGVVLEKDEPFTFGAVMKKSLFKYPKLVESQSSITSLSFLSEDLTFHVSAIPDPVSDAQSPKADVHMEIVSLGPLFMHYWLSGDKSLDKEEMPYHIKSVYTEKHLLLNVSSQLMLSSELYKNISVLSLEGLYDPHVGKMYMIGCRDVRAAWNVLFESMDLEAGLDCLIEVVVSYPPSTAQWLSSPSAKIYISSRRTEDDPLYFKPVKLQTLPILYRRQREDILSRRGVEGILQILTLSFAVGCILSQLLYVRENLDSTPYMSVVMLGVQSIGYGLPLLTAAGALFGRKISESEEMPSYDLERSQWINVLDYTVKLLMLVCLVLILMLFQMIWKSRIRLLTRTLVEPLRVPSDKQVLQITLVTHSVGYISLLLLHFMKTSQTPLHMERYLDSTGNSHTSQVWITVLKKYTGLAQDLFLLPQVLGNVVWQINCKPLRNLYYMGITVVRVLPHIYDYYRAPVSNPYFSEVYEFVNPNMDFYSHISDVIIQLSALVFAVIVYLQQRWNYELISSILNRGKYRILPFVSSKKYEKLPSQVVDSELVSDTSRNDEKRESSVED